jgi:D-glycero-D-manno-heptose 1,7-bisphosphate phosphatase
VAAAVPERPKTQRGTPEPAVFLDRDGTLIEHVHYLSDPVLVRLLPGTAEALKQLRDAGFVLVLVTNQSAIGRGILTEKRLDEIHTELNRQLAICGAAIDAIYYCPDIPCGDDRIVVQNPDRKPGPGMLLCAAAELGLDLGTSWMVGDLISDALAGINAGCRSILLQTGQTSRAEARTVASQALIAPDLAAAAALIIDDRRTQR